MVEVDEIYVGGADVGTTRAPSPESKKSIVAVAIEIHEPKGFGRIRLRRIPDASERSLLPFVRESIEPGSIVRTDGSFAIARCLSMGIMPVGTIHSVPLIRSSVLQGQSTGHVRIALRGVI
jgi:hypothetical protein